MSNKLLNLLNDNPIIAGIKDNAGLEKVVQSDCNIVFVLYGNLCNISDIVNKIKDAGKYVFVDVDLVEGISTKEIVVDFIKQTTRADGILSSKASLLKTASTKGIFTIHRFFVIDSISFHNIPKQLAVSNADCIEILPGCMPKVICWIKKLVNVPIIAGGLVCEKDDVILALKSGAVAISSTCTDVWDNI